MLVNFHQHSDIAYIVNYFVFWLSKLTNEELKAYESFESYNQFGSGWVKETKIKIFKLPAEDALVIGWVST